MNQELKELLRTQRKDGLKSAEVRKERKKVRQLIQDVFNSEPTPDVKLQLLERYNGLDDGDITLRVELIDKLIQKARTGDVRAFKYLCDMSGEVPKEPEHDSNKIAEPITIQVTDDNYLDVLFQMYAEADRTGTSIDEVHDKWESWVELERKKGNIIK